MRARGITMRTLNFLAKNAHMGSPILRINVVHIRIVAYTSKQTKECTDYHNQPPGEQAPKKRLNEHSYQHNFVFQVFYDIPISYVEL